MKDQIYWQFQFTWALAEYHLPALTDDMCLWEPGSNSWNVRRSSDGKWKPDWQVPEPSPTPTPSIGWVTWQILWWWEGALQSLKGDVPHSHENVFWPGNATDTRAKIKELAKRWEAALLSLNDTELARPISYPWPDPQPLSHMLLWVNGELMKNIAEIGYVRHLYENKVQ